MIYEDLFDKDPQTEVFIFKKAIFEIKLHREVKQ